MRNVESEPEDRGVAKHEVTDFFIPMQSGYKLIIEFLVNGNRTSSRSKRKIVLTISALQNFMDGGMNTSNDA